MRYIVEQSILDFPAWSGGADTLRTIVEYGYGDMLDDIFDEMFCDEDKVPTDTEINDILWFERDSLANAMGYYDWDSFERYHAWEEGDEVFWYNPDDEDDEPLPDSERKIYTIVELNTDVETATISLDGEEYDGVDLSELELVKDKK